MLFLLDKDVRTVKWNGIPLHESISAIVKEELNGDFYLTVRYPITDSGINQLIKEDMLIKAPVPVLGAQLFRIKKPVENDDSLDITAYHISDDVMQRSIKPVSVVGQSCAMALSQMVQNAKTGLGAFSFTSDIMDSRTFNTTETETLYSVLMDGKHSIVGTWEGELVRDNFALLINRSRGADRGVVITTHKNLKSYQRTKRSQSVVTRIHARSTFKPEGAEEETKLSVTVDSPLINSYPYINEKEYENNNAKTVEELRKWAEAKFKNDGIDKVSDAIEIEAYELDGQIVNLGDTVNLKSRKHNADLNKKAIAYEFNALTEEYISITFDDKPGVRGDGVSSGLSNAADAIIATSVTAQDIVLERAIRNSNQAFNAKEAKLREEIEDGIKKAEANAEVKVAEVNAKVLEAEELAKAVDERLKKFLSDADTKEQDFDKKLEEFRTSLKDLEVDEKQIDDALAKAGFSKDSLADIKAKLEDTSETATVTANIVGSTGGTFYNRNRLDGDTDKVITFEQGYIDIAHNGEGFEEGKTYTISFEATCELLRKVGITVTQANMKGARLVLTPKNPKLVVESFDLTKDTETINVYPFSYTVLVTSDWYKSKQIDLNASEVQELALDMSYKDVVDGKGATITGAWSDSPQIILDGGKK
ncbi:phage tail spike protein [Streptococcus pyogenes]|uniref:phage tail spike protein n=1 Tax=Streptococcus pyogenes TaxID=1314 RepID=UPI0010F32F80|nr:phage tail spike protein [Streptococcus pyogenes]VGQ65046.1 prophage LambdaSa2, PblB [Streptococcus pyogenes]VHB02845.1 prophage LambdaSa2, PblB [Streptococcus pyogenes]VHC86103.1 prophage LambdaSa2, PblB [Streptococcus pyogenes]